MKRNLELLILPVLLMFSINGWAQIHTVSGIVTDANGNPVIRSSVAIKDAQIRTTTDTNGLYNIEVPKNGILVFSKRKMKPIEKPVNGRSHIDVRLIAVEIRRKEPLIPELVIPGGYYEYEQENLFIEKNGEEVIEGIINCNTKKEELYKNLTTFIATNKYKIVLDKDDRFIFSVEEIPIGNEMINTPIGVFTRSQSDISFNVILDLKDGMYKYTLLGFVSNRRLIKLDSDYVPLAPKQDLEKLKIIGIHIGGLDVESKGRPNHIHWNRVAGLVAERNGYVNLVIKEKKTVSKMKEQYIEKIKKMDISIENELDLYQSEYKTVFKFIDNMNIYIQQSSTF